jgi:phage terminase large subunit
VANKYNVVVDQAAPRGYEFRGDCRAALAYKGPRYMLAGPADTGKTVVSCVKLHLTCLKYPGSQHTILRKTYASMPGSVLQTLGRIIKGSPVTVMGGDRPTKYNYHNGSMIWVGGLDNPDRALSSERDTIYVNQAEEISLKDWETISTRCTGRAAVVPNPQLFGDCNPGGSRHWIKDLAKRNTLKLFNARHQDNPTIYAPDGTVLPAAAGRLDALSSLSGIRRKRLFEGIWATAEGAVYDNFDSSVHVLTRQRTEMRRFFLTLDEGFTNPAVILVVGEDGDGRWHVFQEFYQTGQLQETVVRTALAYQREFAVEAVCVDEAAPGLIADLNACGCHARGGKGRVIDGINRIQNRLKVAGDGRPRLTFDPSCVNCINEFESYVWAPDKPKDTPVKEHDHTSDALRYLDNILNEPTGAWDGAAMTASSTGFELPLGEYHVDPQDDIYEDI